MKKYISLLLVLCIIFSMAPISMSVGATTVNSQATVDRIFGLGLMPHANKAEYIPESPLSRGELAWVLDSIYNYKDKTSSTDFTWQFWGNAQMDIDTLKEAPPMALARFEDVPVSHWAYTIIEDIINSGLMKGVSSTHFMPDENVTVEQLVKCMVVLLGYESKAEYYGGYPTGYMRVASELKLTKNINSSGTVTNSDLIQMLDNCLEVELMDYDGIVTDNGGLYSVHVSSDDTFLTGILGLDKVEGIMTDNFSTSLLGASQVREGEYVIDGIKLKAEEDMYTFLSSFIARDVECYYVTDDTNKKLDYIIYAALTGSDKTITIEANNFLGYDDGTFSYYDNNKVKKETISDFYNVIYNGRALSVFDESIFDIVDGSITLVMGYSDTDIVIIEDYESWFIGAVDYEEKRIYNSLGMSADDSTLVFEDYDIISIYKADGTIGAIEDIAPNTVVNVSRNMNVATIRICDKSEVITIDAISTLNGETVLESDGNKYTVSNIYNNFSKRIEYEIGDELTVYMNKFDKIAWMVRGNIKAYKVGYAFNSTYEESMMKRVGFQIFDETEKKGIDYFTGYDRIKVSDSRGEESYMTIDEFWEEYGSYRGIMRYMTDQNDTLTYFEVPITDVRNSKDNKLNLLYDSDGKVATYRSNNMHGKAILNANTKVFYVDPDHPYDEKSLDVKAASFTSDSSSTTFDVTCYSLNKDSKLSSYVVYYSASKKASIMFANTKMQMMVVDKYIQIYDEDEGGLDAIKGFAFLRSGTGSMVPSAELKLTSDVVFKTVKGNELPSGFKIEAGDIIIYGTNEDGFANEVRVLFDENGKYPYNPDGADGALTDSKGFWGVPETDGDNICDYDEAPFFADNNRQVTTRSSGARTYPTTDFPNPMNISTSEGVDYSMTSGGLWSGPCLIYHGYPVSVKDGALELTTQDLTKEEFSLDETTDFGGKHLMRMLVMPTNVLSVNLSGKDNVEVLWGSNSSLNALRTNELYKNDCSRVILLGAYAETQKLIVINGNLNN